MTNNKSIGFFNLQLSIWKPSTIRCHHSNLFTISVTCSLWASKSTGNSLIWKLNHFRTASCTCSVRRNEPIIHTSSYTIISVQKDIFCRGNDIHIKKFYELCENLILNSLKTLYKIKIKKNSICLSFPLSQTI